MHLMQQVEAVFDQSIFDIVCQTYGNVFALPAFLADNVSGDFNLRDAIIPGNIFDYDIENGIANKKTLRRLAGKIIHTYEDAKNFGAEFNFDFNLDFTS